MAVIESVQSTLRELFAANPSSAQATSASGLLWSVLVPGELTYNLAPPARILEARQLTPDD